MANEIARDMLLDRQAAREVAEYDASLSGKISATWETVSKAVTAVFTADTYEDVGEAVTKAYQKLLAGKGIVGTIVSPRSESVTPNLWFFPHSKL